VPKKTTWETVIVNAATVILSGAKDLLGRDARSFAPLRMTDARRDTSELFLDDDQTHE
jgi:hypothetical protein